MASYRFRDQVRGSSTSRQGLSKSQLGLHKILRIIASSAPPPPAAAGEATVSSNQGSSSSARPEVESERDLSCANRGIGIDLNMEFSLGGGGEGNEAVSAGSAAEGDGKARPAAAAVKEEFGVSGESAAIDDQKSSEGEFDPNCNRDGGDCSPPVAEVSEATNLRIDEIREIGIDGISEEEDDKKEAEEGIGVQNDSRRADEESRVVETATCAGEEKNQNDEGNSGLADRRLTVLIEAADLAPARDSSSANTDHDEIPTTAAEESEEESEPHSPSLRGGRGGRVALRGTKRKRRRNKCWVVDLYRDSDEMRTATTVSKRKRGRRSQVLPSRYRDSSVVMEPLKPPPRRRS